MNEDKSKDMQRKFDSRPPIETVLANIHALVVEMRAEMSAGFAETGRALARLDVRLDRLDALAHQTRAEMLAMRADFNELRNEFREFRGATTKEPV